MSLKDWYYDSGEPHYMTAINKWTEPRRPCHRFFFKKGFIQIEEWLELHFKEGDYDSFVRFNSGDPFLEVDVFDESNAMLFLLSWS